jgi:phage-related protein
VATIARATVEVVADTSRFRRSLQDGLRQQGNIPGFDERVNRQMEQAGRSGAQSFNRGFQRGQTFQAFAELQAQRIRQSFERQLGRIRARIDENGLVQGARRAGRTASNSLQQALGRVSTEFNSNQFVLQARATGQRAAGFIRSSLRGISATFNDSQFVLQARATGQRARAFIESSLRNIRAEINLRSAIREARNAGRRAGDAFADAYNRQANNAGQGLDLGGGGGGGDGGRGLNPQSLTVLATAATLLAVALARLGPLLFSIPAAAGVATAGIATLAVAFQGFGEAIASAGDPEKFAEALKNLSPAAQEVAREFQALNLGDLRLDVQEALFSQLTGTITQLGEALRGPLLEGMTRAAEAFGRFFAQIGDFFSRPLTADAFTAVFDTLAGLLDTIGPGIITFLQGFRDLTVALLPGIEAFGVALNSVLQEFGGFLTDESVAGTALQSFGAALNVVIGLLDVGLALFQALNGIVAGFGPALTAVGEALTTGLQAATPGLTALGAALGAVVEAAAPLLAVVGEIVGILASALAPAISAFAEGFGEIIQTILPVLQNEFLPVLTELAGSIGETLGQAIGSLLDVFIQIVPLLLDLAVQILPILVDMWNQFGSRVIELIPQLVELASVFIVELLPVIISLLPLIIELSTFFADLALTVLPLLIPIVVDLVENISPLIQLFARLAGLLSGPVSFALDIIITVIAEVVDAVRFLIDIVSDAISSLRELIGLGDGVQREVAPVGGNAKGNIFDTATLTWVGEAGREVLVPLAYPDRAVSLARESGLTDLLVQKGAIGDSSRSRAVGDVTINVTSPSANPHHVARRVSAEFARAVWGET